MSFKIGEIVHLKSGGPKMTVKYVSQKADEVWCMWFAKDGELPKQAGFPPDALER